MNNLPTSLTALWDVADDLGRAASKSGDLALDPVGLLLVRPLERWDYDCTPANSLTFAHTGGDGVHFGLLQVGGVAPASFPIVMTVPGVFDDCNRIVAGDFDEFLSVGAINGWFSLEQLVYDLDVALAYLATPDPEVWPDRNRIVALVRKRLGVTPAPLTGARFQVLQDAYGSAISLPEA
jgi:hypothetical protein